jgi:deoxyribonuclease-4
MKLGAHVSVAGGLENGPIEGKSIGAEVIQVFTRNQRQWGAKPVSDEEAAVFRASVAANSIECVMSHASYLLNLAAPSREARAKSAAAFRDELVRCAKLGVQLLNFHPGAHLGAGDDAALRFVADVLREAIETTPDSANVTLVIENTAGQGSCVGHRFEQLAQMLELTKYESRVAICLDTQHSFAAGYDVKSEAGLAATLAEFDRLVGLERLVAFHLNDSKVALGGHVDRHELLGEGTIGFDLFARLARDPRFRDTPGFLETPGGPPIWRKEIARMRRAAAGSGATREQPPSKAATKSSPAPGEAAATVSGASRARRPPRAAARPRRAAVRRSS